MFERVALVGVGLIGGSLGLALRERRLARSVVGIVRTPADIEAVVARGAVDSATADFGAGLSGADLVVLATPIPSILTDLRRLGPYLAAGTVITDVGSTKCEISGVAGECAFADAFVPGHPMAGSERSGIEAARADLFEDAVWALTPSDATEPAALRRVRQIANAVGARVIHLSPEAHDRTVAVTSHLPHVLAYALAAVAGKRAAGGDPVYDLAAGSYRSGTRVAHSDPALWREIAFSNRDLLAAALKEARLEIDAVLDALRREDGEALQAAFERGRDALGKPPT